MLVLLFVLASRVLLMLTQALRCIQMLVSGCTTDINKNITITCSPNFRLYIKVSTDTNTGISISIGRILISARIKQSVLSFVLTQRHQDQS